jgi:hypothetical protein
MNAEDLMTMNRGLVALVLAVAGIAAYAPVNAAADARAPAVRAVYRAVLTAEYFGPARAVCSRLTPAGVRAFTGGKGSCAQAFYEQQQVLTHKTPGTDDSGYSPRAWRRVVNIFMAYLTVTVTGSKATATSEGGLGATTLVRVDGRWLFNSYPPSVGP